MLLAQLASLPWLYHQLSDVLNHQLVWLHELLGLLRIVIVALQGYSELMYESLINEASSSLKWSRRIWYVNLSVASADRIFPKDIISPENTLRFG